MCNLATTLSRTLYTYASGNTSQLNENVTANCDLARSLLYCLTLNMSCDFAAPYLAGYGFDSQPTQYTSVWSQNALLSITAKLIHDVLSNITAVSRDGACESLADCKGSNDLCLQGVCVSSTTYYHDALSLAFELTDSGWSIVEGSSESTWTESK
jgi:hypothetical protein